MAESYNLCLDIGGTKVLGVVFNSKKEIVYRLKKKTKAGGDSSENVEEVIINVVRELINTSGIKKSDIHAIAAGAPGVINQETGVVLFSPNLPWRNYNIRKPIPATRTVGTRGSMSVSWANTNMVQQKATRMLSAFL